jgi:hypothetical protein
VASCHEAAPALAPVTATASTTNSPPNPPATVAAIVGPPGPTRPRQPTAVTTSAAATAGTPRLSAAASGGMWPSGGPPTDQWVATGSATSQRWSPVRSVFAVATNP